MLTITSFNNIDWTPIHQVWSDWWAGDLERPLVIVGGSQPGVYIPQLPLYTAQLPESLSDDHILDLYEANLKTRCWYGDTPPQWKMTFGAGILAAFLGARVNISPETVWFEPTHVPPVRAMEIHANKDGYWWRRVESLTRRAVERWRDKVCISYVDLGGSLDVLASLRTTQALLYELYDAPDQILRLTREVTASWLHFFDELDGMLAGSPRGVSAWAPLWAPESMYMFQCDFAYMISPRMFEQFVIPDLRTCCDHITHSFYHMDGKGQLPHLDLLLSIENLDGIQWIPGEGQPAPEEWLQVLSRIRSAGKLCQVFVTPEGAQKIVRAIGGQGIALAITGDMTPQAANEFMQALQEDQKQALRLS